MRNMEGRSHIGSIESGRIQLRESGKTVLGAQILRAKPSEDASTTLG